MSEFVRGLLDTADPVRLAMRVGMVCDPWQAEALRSDHGRLLLCVHRQGGKSTVAAIMGLQQAVYTPRSTVVVVSPTQRQSSELFKRMLAYYRALGRPVSSEQENALSLSLDNGSRVIALPGSEANVRGFTADLIVVDEASRVPDDLFAALSPMVAVSKGRIVAMSTPWGRRGWFYRAACSRDWHVLTVPATECGRIGAEFLASECNSLGEIVFRSEYLAEFVDGAGTVFRTADIDAMFAAGRLGGIERGGLFDEGERGRADRYSDGIEIAPAAKRPELPEHFEFGKPLPRWAKAMHGGH